MSNFKISSVRTGAEPEFSDPGSVRYLKWTEITLVIGDYFDWEKEREALLKKLKAATELDNE